MKTQLGAYQIVSLIGKGGMGEVYRAHDTRLNRDVAIKVLPEQLTSNEEVLKRFQHEAKILAALAHPNIVTIYDIGTDQNISYLVMELLEGESLRSRLNRSPLSWRNAVQVAISVAEGLSAAHSKWIVHRDLKPENIFLTANGHVKILDFGLAHLAPELASEDLSNANTLSAVQTKSGVVMGTVPYMSPEQSCGGHVDARSDIFSLGSILFEMIAGRKLFARATRTETTAAILKEDVPKLLELENKVPMELQHVLDHCLEKNPENRFQNARDLAFDLGQILNEPTSLKSSTALPEARFLRSQQLPWIFAFIIAGLIILFLWNFSRMRQTLIPSKPVKGIESIAVLPLKNISGKADQEYFADGMTEELISKLARIESLRVISRTSVMEYKGAHKKIPEIAKELNVDAVVEGSVLQADGRVRINAELIHAASDQHLWADSYEGDMRDILALQNIVARSIAEGIEIKVSPREKAELLKKPQVHPEAYTAYLRGLELRRFLSFSREDLKLSAEMFERAVQLDPEFALAFAELSQVHSGLYHLGLDHTQQRLAKAKIAVDRALELHPGLPEAHVALGYYYYWGLRDYDAAIREFGIAKKSLPNDIRVIDGFAAIYRRQGNFEGALSELKKVLHRSPRDSYHAAEIAFTYETIRNYAEAEKYYDRAIALMPDVDSLYVSKAQLYLRWEGDIKRARSILATKPQKGGFALNMIHPYERNYEETLKQYMSYPQEIDIDGTHYDPKALWIGILYAYINRPKLAREAFESARALLQKEAKEHPEDPRFHSALGFTYAGLGLKDAAIREGKLAVQIYPVSTDAFWGPEYVIHQAEILTMLGEYDAALDQIEYALSIPSWLSVPLLQIQPRWDPLRGRPRFQKLLEKYGLKNR